jgi:hypothetical protein
VNAQCGTQASQPADVFLAKKHADDVWLCGLGSLVDDYDVCLEVDVTQSGSSEGGRRY